MNRLSASIVAISLLTLAACSNERSSGSGQVVANVNGEEITLLQIEQMLRGQAATSPEQASKLRAQALETLIDQTLAVQQAKQEKVDRDPQVVSSVESARQRLVAQAFLAQVAAKAARPTEQEAKSFFDKHPELFSQRKIYQVDELAISPASIKLADLKAIVAQSKNIQDAAKILQSMKIKFGVNRGAQAAEGLPMEVARKLNELREGDLTVLELPNAFQVVHLLKVQMASVSFKQAQPAVERYIQNERQREAVVNEMAKLRSAMKTTYFGEFAGKVDVVPVTKAPVAVKPEAKTGPNQTVERGVSLVR